MGPAVRTLLELYDIDAARVTPTGRHGLLKSDVLAYITEHKLTPQPPSPGQTRGDTAGKRQPRNGQDEEFRKCSLDSFEFV